jgi:hypothetical protein
MPLLHIFDSSDSRIIQTAEKRGELWRVGLASGNDLVPALDDLLKGGARFDRVLFETHGSPGTIYFGNQYVGASWWTSVLNRGYTNLTTANSRIYFNGCNVAEGADGWAFLDAAARCFLTPGGGEVFGQTSLGFGNPFNGHVVHLWGTTRRIYVGQDGRIIERFEQ